MLYGVKENEGNRLRAGLAYITSEDIMVENWHIKVVIDNGLVIVVHSTVYLQKPITESTAYVNWRVECHSPQDCHTTEEK
jgi:hypothetical protein